MKRARWNIAQLIGRYKTKTGESLIYEKIRDEIKGNYNKSLDIMTISRMVNNRQKAVNIETLDVLVDYFSKKLCEDLSHSDILVTVDDEGRIQGAD